MAEYISEHLKTPIFIMNSAYDAYQLPNILKTPVLQLLLLLLLALLPVLVLIPPPHPFPSVPSRQRQPHLMQRRGARRDTGLRRRLQDESAGGRQREQGAGRRLGRVCRLVLGARAERRVLPQPGRAKLRR